jgi:hypothetical protein
MSVFFAFSDESGKYKKERTDKFISKNPFYCRSAVLLEAHDWIRLRQEFYLLKKDLLNVDQQQEVKWSHIWSLYKHRQKREPVPEEKPYFSLRSHSLDLLIEFIRRILQLLQECPSSHIMLTLTFNERQKTKPLEIKNIIELHLRHLLEMAEQEMRKIPDSVCVFFLNPEEPRLERNLKDVFSKIYREGLSQKYLHIKDSLNFEVSSQSFGSQLADYCAGVFNGCCRLYPQSIDLFRHQLWPKIIKKRDIALGYGVKEIPGNSKNMASLERILKKVFAVQPKDLQISLEERLKSSMDD